MEEPGLIKKLDEVVVNRIAAGEVIQRPCNALKELIENSLDAKSTNISIVVKAGGLKYLQIQDNGTGIRRENMDIVCERFTTSKLSKFEDLNGIQTYGFRGEALASISHVAHLTIMTKTMADKCAYKATYEDGVLKGTVKPCAGNQGTQITVEDLFYNIGTRKKALKSPSEEYQQIFQVIGSYAIHNYSVGFVLKKFGENTDLRTPVKSSPIENIRIIYGNTIARELLEISQEDTALHVKLHGFVTNVNYSTKKGTMLLFINSRLVESTGIRKAVDTVYSTYLPKNGHSFTYLSLEVDPQNVDVNVHPTKHEVKFLHEEQIIEFIKAVIETKLLSCNSSRVLYTQTRLPTSNITESIDFTSKPQKNAIDPKNFVRTDSTEQKIDKFFGQATTVNYLDKGEDNNLEHKQQVKKTANNDNLESNKSERNGNEPIDKTKPPSPKKAIQCTVMSSTPSHIQYVNPKDSFKTRKFSGLRNETKLTSIKMLRVDVENNCNTNLREILANLVFVGIVDESKALIQHSTKLYLCNTIKLMEELFYEILLYDFQNFGFMKFATPLPIYDLTLLALTHPESGWTPEDGDKDELANQVKDLLVSKANMLLEYYSFEIDSDGNILSLPLLLENYTPFMGALPMYVLQLATEVDWNKEKECFQTFSRITAEFYSKQDMSGDENVVKNIQWVQEHVVYSTIRKYFLPPKQFSDNGVIIQVANLPNLYKVFERC